MKRKFTDRERLDRIRRKIKARKMKILGTIAEIETLVILELKLMEKIKIDTRQV